MELSDLLAILLMVIGMSAIGIFVFLDYFDLWYLIFPEKKEQDEEE